MENLSYKASRIELLDSRKENILLIEKNNS